jgi:peptidoglycan/xylan/chitin deacetylase (PgdA/CDA1 family)
VKRRALLALAAAAALVAALAPFQAVPVLMYHHIAEGQGGGKLDVSPRSFERQMQFLKAHQYRVLDLGSYVRLLKEKRPVPRKAVVITFDDGYDDNFTNAYPILRKAGFPATIFVQAGAVGKPGYLTTEDLRILADGGIEIGSHTVNHAFLPDLDEEGMRREIVDSKAELEGMVGRPVRLFAYPGGGWNATAARLVREAGYEGAAASKRAPHRPVDPYALRRIRISRTADSLVVFWLKTGGFYHWIEAFRDRKDMARGGEPAYDG